MLATAVGGVLLAAAACLAPAVPAGAAEEDPDCLNSSVQTGEITPPSTVTAQSKPLAAMNVTAAQDFLTTRGGQPVAGAGVTVAVLDSGVTPGIGIPLVGTPIMSGAILPAPTYYHGTDTAGLIAGADRGNAGGPVGVAPGAGILDVRVYDDPDADGSNGTPILATNVLAGLQQVAAQVAAGNTLNIKVVAIPLEILPADGMQDVIDQLWEAGVIVVAPAGNRPVTGSTGPLPSNLATPSAGEDAAGEVYPAHYDHVLVAGSSLTNADDGTPAQGYFLQNSEVDVAAPTAGGVSYAPIGGTCVNTAPATSWSTAYVAGVLALDQSYYDEPPAEAVSRVLHTANGRADIPNDDVGAGEVQPLAALTRPLQIAADGTVMDAPVATTPAQVVRAPTTPPDVLASTRHDAIWWGLGGGGALLLALVLRPVLARRRRSSDSLSV